jgi:hypothetical protein
VARCYKPDGREDYRTFKCPGCRDEHTVRVRSNGGPRPSWKFNGSDDRPTFTPSILVTAPPTDYRCHSFVTDGQIRFLDDCNHALAGKTVTLPDRY